MEDLARSLSGLKEVPVKMAFLRDALRDQGTDDVVHFLALALGIRVRSASDEPALLALWLLAGPDADDIRREAIASAARRAGASDVVHFVMPRPADVPAFAARPMPYGGDRPLTLGERKSLARSRDRELLARVLRDPNRDVIQNLLMNPGLRTEDVVRLASRRPVPTDVLRTILADLRWALRYDVRLALVQNPYLELGLAVPLTACLRASDARAVERAASLRPEVREGARRARAASTEWRH